MLLVECFVDARSVDSVLLELEARAARVDEIDRDLPGATVVRAYLTNAALRGFGARLQALAGDDTSFVTNLALVLPGIPLMIILAAYLPSRSVWTIVFVVAITAWATGARGTVAIALFNSH